MRCRRRFVLLAVIALIGATLFRAQAQEGSEEKPPEKQVEHMMRELEARKKERKAAIEKALKEPGENLRPLLAYSIEELQLALSVKIRNIYDGARILSDEDEPRPLGTIKDEFDAKSIFNQYGTHGSRFASDSIWNDFGRYGGQFSTHSPFNPFSSRPPLLLKGDKVLGRLTVNRFIRNAVDPAWLRCFFTY